jgi:hypothetical protein
MRGALIGWLAVATPPSALAQDRNAEPAKVNAMESAKRRVPKPAPVSAHGVRYEVDFSGKAEGSNQRGGVVAAVDEASGQLIWRMAVYPVVFKPAEERDAQEIFITDLALDADGRHLLVAAESRKRFVIDLATRSVASSAP